jgi:hypothetical protein
MIEEEVAGHPLTDEQLAQRLAAEGIRSRAAPSPSIAKHANPSTHQRRAKL